MKTIATIAIIASMALASISSASDLPFPVVAAGKIFLPFGQQLKEPGQKEKITGFENPRCSTKACNWTVGRSEGTIFLTQRYHMDVLVGMDITLILENEAGKPYEGKLRELKRKLQSDESGDWQVTGPADILQSDLNFKAESRDVRLNAKFRKGELSTTITLEISAK